MPNFIAIEYHDKKYPEPVPCGIRQVSANFDKSDFFMETPYYLHTEHCFASKQFSSRHLAGLDEIKNAQRKQVVQLWHGKKWAEEFAEFLFRLIGDCRPPEFIEIHPPFNDYCATFDAFLEIYRVFEERIADRYPSTRILLENRCGTFYTGGRFLLCSFKDILELLSRLDGSERLTVALDFPQLFSIEFHDMDHFKPDKLEYIDEQLRPHRRHIGGVHLWGKKKSAKGHWLGHNGTLDTLFCYNIEHKDRFLRSLYRLLDDELPRYLVLEVNSPPPDLKAIVADLLEYGFRFV